MPHADFVIEDYVDPREVLRAALAGHAKNPAPLLTLP